VAVLAVIGLVSVNLRGITRTARLTRLIVGISLVSLGVVVTTCVVSGDGSIERGLGVDAAHGGLYGVMQAAGLLFFAFAGYARIATLGEEVRDPRRVIPKAIVIALGIAVLLYLAVGTTALATLGPEALAASAAPIADMAEVAAGPWLGGVVVVAASAAALGALLALITGIGRTALAMAREEDLPRSLSAVHPAHHVPHRAEIALAAVVSVLVLTLDLRGAIGFSSFGVLLYYFVANLAAFRQRDPDRRYPRILQVLGAVSCVALVATLPPSSVAAGTAVFAVGVGYRVLRLRRKHGGGR
jgi:APA family basic amino acid/polyamine antiporter